ncbi:ShET2/EspL2 family type III secretion system effector toxin [Candidatus Ichthyocystis sparus]|uniref:ShET2/EspL2 family type III secretion system effector toxin n=1 Tax=Candidatus Ichthyocystis sparus TaxID=1561004 RepID=UPI000B189153|nr:ShET2/EspL2 family type III secretion system effector toxin [Candidatus Ichthyocystis sparus]
MLVSSNSSARIYAHSGREVFPDNKICPYISPKNFKKIHDFNGKVKVNDCSVDCKYLSALFMFNGVSCYAQGNRIKVSSLFASKDSIIKETPTNIQDLYKTILERSCARHIIPCNNFGNFLYEISLKMNPKEQRFFLLESSTHSMSFIISRKVKECQELTVDTWVVNLFDPNRTNVTSRSEVSAPRDFLNLDIFSLKMFIGRDLYELYFSPTDIDNEEENECIIYEYSDKVEADFKFSTLSALSQYDVSACMMYHIMYDGNASFCLADILKRISSCVNKEIRRKVFFAKNSRGTSALYAAMEQGKSQSVKAYNHLLQALSIDEQIDLLPELLSYKSKGVPALFIAMQEGNIECINEFSSLLEGQLKLIKGRMSTDSFVDTVFNLLLAKRDDGVSALLIGSCVDNADVVVSYADLLDKVLLLLKETISADRLADIIFDLICYPMPVNGETSMFLALHKGHDNFVCAIGLLIDRLLIMRGCVADGKLARMIYKILASANNYGTHGLFMALQNGNSNAVLSFGYLMDKLLTMKGCIPDEQLATMIFYLLMSKNGNNTPGLFIAMKNGHHNAIRAFSKLLEKITILKDGMDNKHFNSMLLEIVSSKLPDGTPGLFIALNNNLRNVIDTYSLLLNSIPEDKLVYVLVASNVQGIPGALVAGEEALEVYFSMISSLSCSAIQNLYLEFKRIRKSSAHMFLNDSNLGEKYKLLLSRLKEASRVSRTTAYNVRCSLM